ncbi:MAG TPA: hypothetical protein VLA04_01935 [Verrucomicrobiae bacterium]|nr:hypothetical protein [Verrucomicrobiae bacterium]
MQTLQSLPTAVSERLAERWVLRLVTAQKAGYTPTSFEQCCCQPSLTNEQVASRVRDYHKKSDPHLDYMYSAEVLPNNLVKPHQHFLLVSDKGVIATVPDNLKA